jgi:DNA-binding response OmpR family regulator
MTAKILIVDDEEQIRELLSGYFAEKGYAVILASNGEEAIELVEKETPEVILLDIKMPGTDGIEVCRTLKSGKKTGPIPVIMMTGLNDRVVDAIQARADDLIDKPFNLAELLIRVESICEVGQLADPRERMVAYMKRLEKKRLSWL